MISYDLLELYVYILKRKWEVGSISRVCNGYEIKLASFNANDWLDRRYIYLLYLQDNQ